MNDPLAPDRLPSAPPLPTSPQPPAVRHPHPHESAHLHVSGEAAYVDDLPAPAGTAHAALGLSAHAHARIVAMDLAAVLAAPGVLGVLVAADIPGRNDCGPIVHDDPILAAGEVHYVGQPVFAVIADDREAARRAARLARIDYEALPARLDAVAAARAGELVLPPIRLVRGDADAALAAAPHRIEGRWQVGGQEHFYLEGQVALAQPREDGCMQLWCSSQHPSEMQQVVAHCLGIAAHRVVVEMRRMGGGFGGKESQSALFACVAALAAAKLRRPVKLRPDRDDDIVITGKRHDFHYEYAAGHDDAGRILALRADLIARAGFSADLSGPVATRALCHVDNAYHLPAADVRALLARTHTQSNTAFRGFGGPQGAILAEWVIDGIARTLGRDPLDVRRANFYGGPGRDTTPYGQVVADNVLHELVDELEASSDYRARRAAIAAFNATSPVLRRGLALTPVKFGISFNLTHLNQAGALVHVYTDGSVLVNHGGTEMGQGLHTKVCQVVAAELGIALERVRATATDTSKVPNSSATAASTGADLNGQAAAAAARTIRERLAAFALRRFGEGYGWADAAKGDRGGAADHGGNARAAGHGADPAAVRFTDGEVHVGAHTIPFAELVSEAYRARVQLWSDGFYATPGLHWDAATLTGHPFHYFAYGAAVSEVVVDTLTGEWRLLRADLLHDAGSSINPAIDRGQVEGAFIQGMGWLTLEELRWNAEGRLTTHAPSTYKIPAAHDCPPDLRVRLFDNPNRADTILRSKAVGEPPLLLGFSVFFALRDAIAAAGDGRTNPPLRAPATPEAILDAIDAVRPHATPRA